VAPGRLGRSISRRRWGGTGAHQGAGRLVWAFGLAAWTVPAVGTVVLVMSGGQSDVPSTVLLGGLALVFVLMLTRIGVVAALRPERRAGLGSLSAGLVLWAAGSAVLNSAGQPTVISFPAPGEWLFLAAYAGFAAYLFADAPGRARRSVQDWLEAVVACGGAACVAGLLVVAPVASDFARQGVPLMVALVYPLLDATLLVIVVGQVVLGQRAFSLGTAAMALGAIALGAADITLVTNLSQGTYAYGLGSDLLWCLGFLLLVESALLPDGDPAPRAPQSATAGLVTLSASAAALLVVTFQPSGEARPYVVVPAVVTLVAAVARLLLALREATDAAEAYRLSRTDDLTGLPNRRAVVVRLGDDAIGQEPVAVMLLDLDGFKEVNDSLGHAAGDHLLQVVARRLRNALPENVLAARLGGDEFAVILPEPDPVALLEVAHHIRSVIRAPIPVEGLDLSIEASIGVAPWTADVATHRDLLRCADVAMYQAKTSRAGALLYDAARDEFSRSRLALAEDLRRALDEDQLTVFYQPQVDALTGAVSAVEALVRWRHPSQGLLAPAAFLPAARRAGLMSRLTETVLTTTLQDLAQWRRDGVEVRVAVNVAPPELLDGPTLSALHRLLRAHRVPAGSVALEVTEESFLAEPEHARQIITDLHRRGVQVSIDDYGTGFSSLSYLRDLPVQELKIDRSFVANILTDRRAWMIVSTTSQLARGLGMRTVAEGVEDPAQAAELLAIGVESLQGYHITRPMPAGFVSAWVQQRRLEGGAGHTPSARRAR